MTYYLDPFGCVKNQVDAENMMAFLNRSGWTAAESADTVDLVIVNSCGFIESAKQESINAVLAWRKMYPEKKILLAGCLSQRYAKELAESLPEADGIFGNSDLAGIVQAAALAAGKTLNKTAPASSRPPPDTGARPLLSLPGSAYVKISEGCGNRCSYCAIPLIRGGLRSRSVSDITDECRALVERGIKEICLVGQDTGSYGRDSGDGSGGGLPGLLQAISRLKGEFRVRLLYIHPDHFPLPILDIMEEDPRFLPYFDIPFQHGSEKILRLMNRRGNAAVYLDLVEALRRRFPDAAIRSTFMTGFPGETEEDFQTLLEFQQKARLDWLGCFAYSREEDTPAWGMKGRVAKKTAARRKRLVEERQIPITERQMERFIGRTFDVLVEEQFKPTADGPSTGEEELYLGRLPCQAPEIDGSAVIVSPRPLESGALVSCRVFARAGIDLQARPEGA
ncbi:MAG: 30S ribosomal protein S12 methylthiotransferase RimO [Treponema sp.]|nr:30S ribosomal protein S12 methylthiotransferase RimO [Treponema sp.]